MLSDPIIRAAEVYAQNLQVIRSYLLDGIVDPQRHIADALKHNKVIDHLTTIRTAQDAYWEKALRKIHWEIDGPDILNALSNDRPIEQVVSHFFTF